MRRRFHIRVIAVTFRRDPAFVRDVEDKPRGITSAAPGLFLALAAAGAVLHPALDVDLGWHLRAGQLILASRSVPRSDVFSGPMAGHPWVDNEWLWEASLAAMANAGGLLVPIAANALLMAVAVVLVYATLRLRRVPSLLAAGGALVMLAVVAHYADVRPGMAAIVLAPAVLYLLERHRTSGDWRWLVGLLPLEALWANWHGSYLLGLGLAGIYFLGALWGQAPRADWLQLLAGGLAMALVTLANPRGVGLWRFTLMASQLKFNREAVQAWMPPNFGDVTMLPLLACLLASLALLVCLPSARLPKNEALLLLACTLAALQSKEFLPLYGVAAAPLLAQMGQGVLRRPGSRQPSWPEASLLLLSAALLFGRSLPSLQADAYQETMADVFPVQAVQFIKDNQLPGPLWNDFNWGGYLMSALPRLPVFVDSRTEMYGDEFLFSYLGVNSGKQPYQPMMDRYGIRVVLISSASALANELRHDPAWSEAYRDEKAAVFIPTNS